MDPIDYQLLELLQRDARTTQVQLAAAVGLSQPAVAERVHKLEAAQAIRGYVARLDARGLGNDICAFIGVRVAHPRHHDAFARAIHEIPEVLECHRVAGADSYLLKVITRNTETLDALISSALRRIAGVTRTNTTIALSTIKEESAIPLPDTRAPARRRKEP